MKTIRTIVVDNAGGTTTMTAKQIPSLTYLKTTSVVLAANYSLAYAALPVKGSAWAVIVGTGVDLNIRTFTVFGVPYTTAMQASGLAWIYEFAVVEFPTAGPPVSTLVWSLRPMDWSATNFLSGTVIKDGTLPVAKLVALTAGQLIIGNASNIPTATAISGDITISGTGVAGIGGKKVLTAMINDKAVQILQMADLARGSMYVGDATNRPSAFSVKDNLKILMGNGNDPVMVSVGGDLTMPALGVFRLVNTVGAIYRINLPMDAAAITTGNSVPLEILAAQGIDRTINVIDVDVSQTVVTTPYATNTTLEVYTEGATVAQKSLNCLGFTANRIVKMSDVAIAAAGNTQLIPNARLMCRVATGDPTAGDGTMVVSVYFTILTQ